jgi:hypothetical protein
MCFPEETVRFLRRNERYFLLQDMRDTSMLQMHQRNGGQTSSQIGLVPYVRGETHLEFPSAVPSLTTSIVFGYRGLRRICLWVVSFEWLSLNVMFTYRGCVCIS